jgi:hypothetical protein
MAAPRWRACCRGGVFENVAQLPKVLGNRRFVAGARLTGAATVGGKPRKRGLQSFFTVHVDSAAGRSS